MSKKYSMKHKIRWVRCETCHISAQVIWSSKYGWTNLLKPSAHWLKFYKSFFCPKCKRDFYAF